MTATTSTRPYAMPLNVAGLPDDPIMDERCFVNFRLVPKPDKSGKSDKIPINPRTGDNAKSNDRDTWGNLAEAVAGIERHQCDGISIVLDKWDISGIDLDNCRDRDTEEIAPWAQAIIDHFSPCYWGPSVSGTGIRILIRATLPAGGHKRGDIEVYDDGRHLTLTGHLGAGAVRTLEPRRAALDTFLTEYFPAPKPRPTRPAPPAASTPTVDGEARLAAAQRDPKFARLWDGNDAEYNGDRSAGDGAFVMKCLFYAGGDRALVDAWYRRSPRARAKWDERHYGDGRTYGEGTIDSALATWDGRTYDPTYRPSPSAANFDPERDADLDAANAEELRSLLRAERQRRQAAEERAARAEKEARAAIEAQRTMLAALRNPRISNSAEKLTFAAAALEYASAASRHRDDPDWDGWMRLPLARVEEATGHKPKRASAHLARGEEYGVLERDLRRGTARIVDRTTGEVITRDIDQLYVRFHHGRAVDILEELAVVDPGKPELRGGPRECPRHPGADYVTETTIEKVVRCVECRDELERSVERRSSTRRREDEQAEPLGGEVRPPTTTSTTGGEVRPPRTPDGAGVVVNVTPASAPSAMLPRCMGQHGRCSARVPHHERYCVTCVLDGYRNDPVLHPSPVPLLWQAGD